MKKVYTTLIGLYFALTGFSQSCLPDGIEFTTQAQIDSFQVNYPNCTQIEGFVVINGDDITNLNGLNVVTFIGAYLSIEFNSALTRLTGLEGLTSIGSHLYICYNASLTSLTGLEGLTSIGSYLLIGYNESLTSLTGLENVTSIGSYLLIEGNDALTSLTGLDNITAIGLFIKIWFNDALTSLTGLENVTSIGSYLFINFNESLSSLTGLDNVDAGTITDLTIFGNPNLSTCNVQSICDYLVAPNGTIYLQDNATGCNSVEEVEEACGVGLDESAVSSRQSAVNIYPNPSSTTITISTPTTPEKNTFMTIIDITGKEVLKCELTQEQNVVDVSGLSQGVYFVRVADDRTVQMGKFIKE